MPTDRERRRHWAGIGVALLTTFSIAAVGWYGTARSVPSAHLPLWPIVPLVVLAVIGFYFVLAPTLGLPVPLDREDRQLRREGLKSISGYRTPGEMGHASMSLSVKLPDGRQKVMTHGTLCPRPAIGNLPVAIDMEGLGGGRATRAHGTQEFWNWSAPDVVFVNQSDETIVCRVWLVAYVRAKPGIAQIKRLPNDAISLEPKGTIRVTLDFQMALLGFDDDAKLDPARPKELVFLEIGAAQRELRLPFPTEPFPQATTP